MDVSRRDLLALGGLTVAGATLAPSLARAQTPKRGGTLALRTWDPPHFDPLQTISYKTHIALSFTHSRLLKHKAGPERDPRHVPASRATWPSRGASRTRRPTCSSSARA